MRRFLLWWVGLTVVNFLFAQSKCGSFEYQKQLTQANPSLELAHKAIENFVFNRESLRSSFSLVGVDEEKIITIPVVVHILYHFPGENISDDLVHSQIFALNRDYRKMNADTSKIPGYFKPFAADCEIAFKLATVDASGRATTGIIHKYTPVTKWTADDKIKYSTQMGDDAWDPGSYLNIWVGTMRLLGYSSTPGDPANNDGVVISNTAFGITNSGIYDQGRTAVHEVGHWLGLRHLWGDANCGDDGIADTPQQQTFTNGCPSTVRTSCNNGPNGDMYMDYMDFTNDDCLVMFTRGQRQRMRSLFDNGGPRYSILSSKGLDIPLITEMPLPENPPKWLQIKIFPNPTTSELTINMEYDQRWLGNQLQVIDMTGKIHIVKTITSTIQKLDVSQLAPGVYFLKAEKSGEKMMQKFIKL